MADSFQFLRAFPDDEEVEEHVFPKFPPCFILHAPLFLYLHFTDVLAAHVSQISVVEELVPLYSLEDFRQHFRVTRPTFSIIVNHISRDLAVPVVQVYGREPVDFVKQVLLYLLYAGTQESYLNVADRLGVSKSTAHAIVKQISLALNNLLTCHGWQTHHYFSSAKR